ncbi:hypothetical protein T07_10465 [Trichinella nelsoni]|uniref:Uncharacterized protein n=1 Tax=Trichinella nelsoni TaxID=6336 RepID=A0A0V0RVH2_9BILA|nr:hypothetical protein T07_10465 [Trichinella nelsoni]
MLSTRMHGSSLGKQQRSWQKSTPGSPQHPYTRTDTKGALKDNGNYSAKQVWRSCFTNRRFSVAASSGFHRRCASASSVSQYHQLLGTFYLPDHACNDYFWQTLLLATGEYAVEVMFQQRIYCLDVAYYPEIADFRVPFAEIGAISIAMNYLFHSYFSCCAVLFVREAGKGERTGIADAVRDNHRVHNEDLHKTE